MTRFLNDEDFGTVAETVQNAFGPHVKAAIAAERAARKSAGWIVSNGNRDRFRCWTNGMSDWTADRDKATRYARREDAEAVHADDEDAWQVLPYGAPPADLAAIVAERDALKAWRAEASDTIVTLTRGREQQRERAEAARDEAADKAADFIFDVLSKAVGSPIYSPADGSETWEGDVAGTVYTILRAAKVIDPETDVLATERAEAAEKDLAAIEAMFAEGQGDDDGPAILPEFEDGMTTLAKVEACLHLLERRRDALIPAPSGEGESR